MILAGGIETELFACFLRENATSSLDDTDEALVFMLRMKPSRSTGYSYLLCQLYFHLNSNNLWLCWLVIYFQSPRGENAELETEVVCMCIIEDDIILN